MNSTTDAYLVMCVLAAFCILAWVLMDFLEYRFRAKEPPVDERTYCLDVGDCEVELIRDRDGYLVCSGCLLNDRHDLPLASVRYALTHLTAHQQCDHHPPLSAFAKLRDELKTEPDEESA